MPPKKIEKKVEKKVEKTIEKKTRKTKKTKDVNGPKKNKSAYMFFCAEGRLEIKAENSDLDNKGIVVELGARWNKLKESNGDKLKYYNDLAEEDKKRYLKEKESYVKDDDHEEVEGEEEVKDKDKKKKKQSSASDEPKKKTKINGYINFCTINREQYKSENPELLPKDITRKLSEGWKSLSEEEKEKYKNSSQ